MLALVQVKISPSLSTKFNQKFISLQMNQSEKDSSHGNVYVVKFQVEIEAMYLGEFYTRFQKGFHTEM